MLAHSFASPEPPLSCSWGGCSKGLQSWGDQCLLDNAVFASRHLAMLLALAAQLSSPTVTNAHDPNVAGWITRDDQPDYLFHQARANPTVYTRTTVRPDGTIQNCVVERSSGDRDLDAYTCQLIRKRAKFLPARWLDGSAVYGVLRTTVRWSISEDPMYEPLVTDLELPIDHLPQGAASKVYVDLEIAVDETGHPVSCNDSPQSSGDDQPKHYPELVPIACQRATASLVFSPPVDASGKPARSIQNVSARFKLGK